LFFFCPSSLKKVQISQGRGCIFPPDWPKSFAMSIVSNIAEGKNSKEYCRAMFFSFLIKTYNYLNLLFFKNKTTVKVAARIHYTNMDRLLRHWVYSGNQLMFSLLWVPDP
jgi:hypothetical protein